MLGERERISGFVGLAILTATIQGRAELESRASASGHLDANGIQSLPKVCSCASSSAKRRREDLSSPTADATVLDKNQTNRVPSS